MKQDAEQEKNTPVQVKVELSAGFLSSVTYFDTGEAPVFDSAISYYLVIRSGQPIDRSLAIFHPPSA